MRHPPFAASATSIRANDGETQQARRRTQVKYRPACATKQSTITVQLRSCFFAIHYRRPIATATAKLRPRETLRSSREASHPRSRANGRRERVSFFVRSFVGVRAKRQWKSESSAVCERASRNREGEWGRRKRVTGHSGQRRKERAWKKFCRMGPSRPLLFQASEDRRRI